MVSPDSDFEVKYNIFEKESKRKLSYFSIFTEPLLFFLFSLCCGRNDFRGQKDPISIRKQKGTDLS